MKKLLFGALFVSPFISFAQETSDSINISAEAALQVAPEARPAAVPQRFGYLSYNEILKVMPEYSQAMKNLEDLKASYDGEMTRAEQEFSKKYAEYIDGQASFTENIMLKRQKELQQLMEQSLAFKKEAQQLLIKAENDVMAPLHRRLKDAIAKAATNRNCAYVLNTDNNSYPFINPNSESEDITNYVLMQLGLK